MTQFILKIDLDNKTMQNTKDVMHAMSKTINQLRTEHENKIICTHKGLAGNIRDENGNIVGYWKVI